MRILQINLNRWILFNICSIWIYPVKFGLADAKQFNGVNL